MNITNIAEIPPLDPLISTISVDEIIIKMVSFMYFLTNKLLDTIYNRIGKEKHRNVTNPL